MIQFLLTSTILISLTFIFLNHPLSMGFALLIQAIIIAMITGTLSHTFWFSYILFMVMIGGMLVLFIYMTSVASNEKFMYSNKLMIMISSMIIMNMMLFISFDQLMTNLSFKNIDLSNLSMESTFSLSLSKYINFPSNMIMVMMIIYLLITLIAVVKITNITYGPLRQKF